jgi:hypothetical protein
MHGTRILICLVTMCIASGPVQAKAPAGRLVVDVKGETVYDNWTQRTWQRAVDAGSYNWANAKSYCSSLGLAGGGWHLPDIRELRSIVDRQQTGPAIDPAAFPGATSAVFWSATSWAKVVTGGQAWSVDFGFGISNGKSPSGTYRVRCVR